MSKFIEILKLILIISLLGIACFFGIKSCNSSKKNIQLSKELEACRNAPIKIDTIYDTIRSVEYVHLTPRPRPIQVGKQEIQETRDSTNTVSTVYYSDTFTSKGTKIHWEAGTAYRNDSALLEFLRFPEIVIPQTTITKTIHDTVKKEVPTKLRGKFAMYGGMVVNDFRSFPGMELGVGYVHKQSWCIMAGPSYIDKKLYGSVKLLITF